MYGPTTHTRLVEMWMVNPTTNSQETASATNKHKPYSDVNEIKYSCIITIFNAIIIDMMHRVDYSSMQHR